MSTSANTIAAAQLCACPFCQPEAFDCSVERAPVVELCSRHEAHPMADVFRDLRRRQLVVEGPVVTSLEGVLLCAQCHRTYNTRGEYVTVPTWARPASWSHGYCPLCLLDEMAVVERRRSSQEVVHG